MWLIFVFTAISLLFPSKAAFFVSLAFAGMFFWHYIWEVSRGERLNYVVLLPINRWWARVLLRGRIKGRWDRACEIHVKYQPGISIKDQREGILQDLLHIYRDGSGLYLWETATSVPGPVKAMIEEQSQHGLAFWSRGCFLPRFPFVYTRTGKRLRHGAFLIARERIDLGKEKSNHNSDIYGGFHTGDRVYKSRGQCQV